jgi:hypothetical protein
MSLLAKYGIGIISMLLVHKWTTAILTNFGHDNVIFIIPTILASIVGFVITRQLWFSPVVIAIILGWIPIITKDSEGRLFGMIIILIDMLISFITGCILIVVDKVMSIYLHK